MNESKIELISLQEIDLVEPDDFPEIPIDSPQTTTTKFPIDTR